MKKIMILAASAAIVLSACAKIETEKFVDTDNVLTFGVYAGKTATKATYGDITTDNLKTSADGFGVFSYYTMATDWAATNTPNFMYNQQVKYNDAANTTLYPQKWEYTPLKYWPNGNNATEYPSGTTSADKLSFFAYAPHIATADLGTIPAAGEGITALTENNAAGSPKVTFTVPSAADKQIDLLWATPQMNKTKAALTGTVDFSFKHALAKLNYQVQAVVDATAPTTSNLGSETKIILESLVIEADGTKTGTLDLSDGSWSSVSGKSSVTYNTSAFASTTTVNGKTGFNVTETARDLNSTISPMIIPATMAAGKYTVKANYWVITEDSALAGSYSTVQNYISKSNAADLTFEKGKKYTIVVRLGLNSVDFKVTDVEAWTEAAGDPVDLPLNF